jgi:hypothetical protein
MAFTPLHLGPALFLGVLLLVEIDFPTFLLANVVVDLRAILVLVGVLDGPIHGPLHTALGGLALATVLTAGSYAVRRDLDPVTATLRLAQDWSLRPISLASVGGVGLHLLIDAFLYEEMALLYPVAGNPLAGIYGLFVVYGVCLLAGVLGVTLYGGYLLGVVSLRTPLRKGG